MYFSCYRPAQAVKILVGAAVFCTFGLQFYVCLDIGWNTIKDKCQKRPLLANYIMRTVLVTGSGTNYIKNIYLEIQNLWMINSLKKS